MLDHQKIRIGGRSVQIGRVRRIVGEIATAFEVLTRIQYAAPWQADETGSPATRAPGPRSDASSGECRA